MFGPVMPGDALSSRWWLYMHGCWPAVLSGALRCGAQNELHEITTSEDRGFELHQITETAGYFCGPSGRHTMPVITVSAHTVYYGITT
jgi:hypothetical protein